MDWTSETEPIHLWFSLSYANYLVMPRSVLQSMPREWQAKFVILLEEAQAAFGHLEWPHYYVQCLAREQDRIYHDDCYECEGEGLMPVSVWDLSDMDTAPLPCETCNGEGEIELDEPRLETPEEVGIIDDPIPHYDRGRTRLEPRNG